MQEFEHTSRNDRTYTEEERSCPYFDEFAKDLKEEKIMTAKECLVEFKKNYCEKNPESNGDPDFRCNGCLFSTDTRCLINTFISRHEQKEYFGSKNVKEDK